MAGCVAAEIVDHIYDVVDPQEVAEIAVENMAHGAGSVGKHIFYVSAIHKTAHRARQHCAVVLLECGLSLTVEAHHIVSLALEEIFAIFGFAVGAVACILDNIDSLVEEYERIGIGMAVVPCGTALYGEHGGVAVPAVAHSGPSEVFP